MPGGEKRRTRRQDVRWKGLILDDQGSIIATCMMTDVSATGAKLIMEAGINVPDCFVLTLARNAGVRRDCDVVWRAAKSIGVRFVDAPR
ncbi:MAG: PilZ domain-containing protein [Limisphaerales bacterium]